MTARLRIGACLSLSGRFAQFGRQAANGLETWRSLTDLADVVVEDDRSDKRTLQKILPDVAGRSDLLLGPYSTVLMRAAGDIAADRGWLVWNHGGSGDDVEAAHPGNVVSVLTPTSRYTEPFLRHIADDKPRGLYIASGPGSFGRQVTGGAEAIARELGIRTSRLDPENLPSHPGKWDLLSVGVFEDDAELVNKALRLPDPPGRICAIAAGVREFSNAVDDPEGIYGIAQWFPGSRHEVEIGPSEEDFLRAYHDRTEIFPDYPAAQAAAGAALAVHCVRLADATRREDLWAAAGALDTSTLFGAFRIDRSSGIQVKHQTVLLRWIQGEPQPVSTPELAA